MALVTTTISGTKKWFPFSGLNAVPRERSDVPRGELLVSAINSPIAATGVGDNQMASFSASLPKNFSYVLCDFYLSLFGDTGGSTNNFEDLASFNLNNSVSGTDRDYTLLDTARSFGEISFGGSSNKLKTYELAKMPKLVILPSPGQQSGLTVQVTNPVTNDQAYTANSLFRFLVFDVEQTHHFQVNTPVPVR